MYLGVLRSIIRITTPASIPTTTTPAAKIDHCSQFIRVLLVKALSDRRNVLTARSAEMRMNGEDFADENSWFANAVDEPKANAARFHKIRTPYLAVHLNFSYY
jgi:hypothetical protein